jgi:hypothetical protein
MRLGSLIGLLPISVARVSANGSGFVIRVPGRRCAAPETFAHTGRRLGPAENQREDDSNVKVMLD